MHHTTGLKCDRCKRGYYGNATIGTPDDCKPCACPLENPENNFSPSCTAIQTATGDSDYICDQCPEGYDGNKCERYTESICKSSRPRTGKQNTFLIALLSLLTLILVHNRKFQM